jgi:CAAX prenyl protease-like protein
MTTTQDAATIDAGKLRRDTVRMPQRRMQPWLPFVLPYALFVVLTAFDGSLPGRYPLLYTVKIVLVTVVAWVVRPRAGTYGLKSGPLSMRSALIAAAAGAVLTVAWVVVDQHTRHFALLGRRIGFDPFHEIADRAAQTTFLAIRFAGLALLVPWTEELFFRGFLLRYITDQTDWEKKAPEMFSTAALAVNVACFAMIHPEWLAAGIFAASMAGLLRLTKDVRACIVAHAACNLLLGIYVVQTGNWRFW